MLIGAADRDLAERQIAASELACPNCQDELGPWGPCRRRRLRTRHGRSETRSRRGCCRGCARQNVLALGRGAIALRGRRRGRWRGPSRPRLR